jgi:ubiquinone/menaquinone biosynthesis C-methylase UbiE
MFMNLFGRRENPYMLEVGMTGVKMGDCVAFVGCAHGPRLAAIAAKVGLSGRALAIVPDQDAVNRVRKAAEAAGVLVEIQMAHPARLRAEDEAFDVVVVDDTGGLLAMMRPEDRTGAFKDMRRIVRPGGRVVVMGAVPRGGIGAVISRAHSGPPFDPTPWLTAEGFRPVRLLAERDGLKFIEAMRPRTT